MARAPETARPAVRDPISLAILRSEAYRLHAAAFLTPTRERWSEVGRLGLLLAQEARLRHLPWADPLTSCATRLAAAAPDDTALATHVTLFDTAADGPSCPPFAAEYAEPHIEAWNMDPEVERVSNRIAVAPRARVGARADHLSVELEMLAVLCRREAAALGSDDQAAVDAARRDAERFLRVHVQNWFPRFRQRVKENDQLGVATATVESALSLLREDHAYLVSAIGASG